MNSKEKKLLLITLENLLTAENMGFNKEKEIKLMDNLLNQIGLYKEASLITGKCFFRSIDAVLYSPNCTKQPNENIFEQLFELIYESCGKVLLVEFIKNDILNDIIKYDLTPVDRKKANELVCELLRCMIDTNNM